MSKQRLQEMAGLTPDKQPIKEFYEDAGMNARSDKHFERLVPGSGGAGTVEGEMLRAINKIIYRLWNDGDYFFKGYGIETIGPAHSYLINSPEIDPQVHTRLNSIFSKAEDTNDDEYAKYLYEALAVILDQVEKMEGNETPTEEEMYDYNAEFEDNWDEGDNWDEDRGDYYYDDEEDEDDVWESKKPIKEWDDGSIDQYADSIKTSLDGDDDIERNIERRDKSREMSEEEAISKLNQVKSGLDIISKNMSDGYNVYNSLLQRIKNITTKPINPQDPYVTGDTYYDIINTANSLVKIWKVETENETK